MRLFQDMSLRRKQTLIIMLTSSVVLVLACAAFSVYEVITFRKGMVQHLSTLAEIVGNNTSAGLDFNDSKSVVETLSALQAEPGIIGACIYGKGGEPFATYDRANDDIAFTPPALHTEGHAFVGQRLILSRPISYKGETIGAVYLESDMRALFSRLWRYAGIVGLVFLMSLVVALVLSSKLQRLVSDPVLQLAQAARAVALEKNYSVRATKQSNDELGQLVDGFNEMLTQIQQRDAALQSARENLEHRVVERTRELNYERELFQALLDHSPDSIYFKDAQSRFLKSSESQVRLFGMKSVDDLIGKSDFDFFTDEHARPAFEDEQEIIRTGVPLIGKVEKETMKDGRERWALTSKMPLRNQDGQITGTFGISKDITAIKEAEAKLEQVHKQLLETSRQAGMAEIATNILHNVGNVLNSVNVSASLVADSAKKSKAANLGKVVAILQEHEHDLGAFITTDPKGKQLPIYLAQLSDHLLAEQKATVEELASLVKNIEHIKDIVSVQQDYARVSGITELINIGELVEDSLRMNVDTLDRHRVEVIREFEDVPLVNIDKHKVLQILVNLIRNAKHACQDSARADKRLTVRVTDGDNRIKISVIDNGIGIPPENLTRIFNHGFTTRKGGHGFGLHTGALAAKELGGSLKAQSDGIGRGATFTLELLLDQTQQAA